MSNGEKERQLRREMRRIERKKQERIRQLLEDKSDEYIRKLALFLEET